MQRIYSNENLKQEEASDSSSIQSEISRGTKTREKFEALNDTQKRKIYSLLDEWEEPDRTSNDDVSGCCDFTKPKVVITPLICDVSRIFPPVTVPRFHISRSSIS